MRSFKQTLVELIRNAVRRAHEKGRLTADALPGIEVEEPKIESHGDFSTNVAMVMASLQKTAPRQIAEAIIDHLDDPEGIIAHTDIAGPGFINFFINPAWWHPVISQIHRQDLDYGRSNIGQGLQIMVEFVSANPTGPLHVGHGRGAAVGDSLARILAFSGYDVKSEYYINDSGRQISTLGRSAFLRYQQLSGRSIEFPDDCYQGDYIYDLAREIQAIKGEELLASGEDDALIFCARFAADRILAGIKTDLSDFNVTFDNWFSEQGLYDSGQVEHVLNEFRKKKTVYEKDGALWFNARAYGDEKDRVVVRNNGQTTYFASDIAYHKDKFLRGFDQVVDVWGADHHGYIPRMTAAVEALGHDRSRFKVILVQLVNLLRGGAPVAMSTRAGEFVTLEEIVAEVGSDAARFIFLTRHYESPLDFDLELAKKKSNDNPVFYVQYVHARISSIARKGAERGIEAASCPADIHRHLTAPEEIQLMKNLARFPETVAESARAMEPHRITFYLTNLAAGFHAYYNKHRVLTDAPALALSRLFLVLAVKKVIRNGLDLLGVSAPESM
jgi:arginyl-tRNA synthetase